MNYTPLLQQFSDSYYLFSDARVIEYGEDYPVVANDTYEFFNERQHEPLMKVGNSYVWPKGERTVPPDVVAVPEGTVDAPEHAEVLVPNYDTTEQLIETGAVHRPKRS